LNEGNHRIAIWKIAMFAAIERPLAGYGMGNFELALEL
jgi:O-antigen ligase